MLFEIKSRYTASVLFSLECGSMKVCVEAAVRSHADLRYADLRYANLSSADLSSADLSSADLSSADLRYANLRYANLRYANLSSADLSYADLSYAKWPKDATVLNPPLMVWGLLWPVTIFGSHMQIGCEVHSMREWEAFDDRRILEMSGKEALEFWRLNKTRLLAFRDTESEEAFAAKQIEPVEAVAGDAR